MKRIFLLLGIFFIINSCSDEPTGPTNNTTWENDKVTFDVELQEELAVFEENDPKIKDINEEENTITISTADASDIYIGRVILIKNKMVRKVVDKEISGSNTILYTEPGTLDKVFKNADIEWDKGIEFDPDNVPVPQILNPNGKFGKMKQVNEAQTEFEFKVGEFDGKISFEAAGEQANVVCELTKDLGANIKASYKFEGNISRFRSKGEIDIKDSVLKNFGYSNENMKGELTLTLIATSTPNDLLSGFELPVLLLKVPYVIGFVPVELNIRCRFVINTALTGLDASSWISAKFKYDSDYGLKYDGTNFGTSIGDLTYSTEKNKTQTGGASAGVSANFGVGFPRIEVSIFRDVVVPYIQTGFLIGGFYRMGTKPCQEAKSIFQGDAGCDLSLFGLFGYKYNKTLWSYEKILLKSGDCD